jgi:hypothetical protein
MTDHNSSNNSINNSTNKPSDCTDQQLSDLYQQAPEAHSPQGLDDTILARASVQAERLRQQPRGERRPALLSRKWVTLAATGCVITLTISLVVQMPGQGPWLDESTPETVFSPVDSNMRLERKQKVLGQAEAPMQVTESRERLEEVVVTSSSEDEAFLDAEQSEYDAAEPAMPEPVLVEKPVQQALKKEVQSKPLSLRSSVVSSPRKRALADRPTVSEAAPSMTMSDMAADMAVESTAEAEGQNVEAEWTLEQWLEELTTLLRDKENDQALDLYERFLKQYPDYSNSASLTDDERKLFERLDTLKNEKEKQN